MNDKREKGRRERTPKPQSKRSRKGAPRKPPQPPVAGEEDMDTELKAQVTWMAGTMDCGPDLESVNTSLHLGGDDPSLERLFSTQARLVPFSHRPLFSIRHPYVHHCTLSCGNARKRRMASTDSRVSVTNSANIVQKLKFKNPAQVQAEERKWVELAHLVDVVALEDEVCRRRTGILTSGVFLKELDVLWQAAVGTDTAATMPKPAYIDVTCAACKLFLGQYTDHGTEYFSIMMRGAESDWETDANGRESISYGDFSVSMLELVDNWTSSHSAEAYAHTLANIAAQFIKSHAQTAVTTSPRPSATNAKLRRVAQSPRAMASHAGCLSSPKGGAWSEQKALYLRHHASGYFSFMQPCVAKIRSIPGSKLGEYYTVPVKDLDIKGIEKS